LSEQPITPEEAPAPATKGSKAKLALIIVIIIVIGIGGYIAAVKLTSSQKYPWLFKGAYADYEGIATITFFNINMKVHIEVVDCNETHAKLLMRATVSAMGVNETSTNTTWVDLRNENYIVSGKKPDKVYDETINVKGIGKLDCKVYEYHEDSSVTRIYVDKETVWPVKMEFEEPTIGTLTLTITDTNIPGLKG
jgi:hypothetical protein